MFGEYAALLVAAVLVNNFVLVQFLGLCPFMGVSNKLDTAIGMSAATTFVLTLASVCSFLTYEYLLTPLDLTYLRTLSFILVIAVVVQFTEMVIHKTSPLLYQLLGIFLPLITTNCVILGRADAFAAKNPLGPALVDGLMMGIGFGAVLVVLGAIRELLGTGMLFANMDLLFGVQAASWTLVISENYVGFLLAILPPGAFIITGLLIAAKNIIDTRIERRKQIEVVTAGSKRVRVTGDVA